MGIFYVNVRTVSRLAGRRAIAAAAYCSRSKLWDAELGREVDFSAAPGFEHSEILLPSGAPMRWMDRAALWNEVEAIERRDDAQLAREIEIAIPGDLRADEGIGLARGYMWEEFVERGMVVDLNIHRACAADGMVTWYVHALFSMREIVGEGFGRKRSDWKAEKLLLKWRERWVELLNGRVLAAGRRGLARRGADAARGRGLDVLFEENGADRSIENFEIGWRNGERLLAEPGLALDALTRRAASFTRAEMAAFVRRNTAGDEQYEKALARIESSVDLVRLAGEDRFSVRRLALGLRRAATAGHDAEAGEGRGTAGDCETRRTLGEALALWEAAGLRVRGVGQTYEAAKVFEKRTGIKSVGVHGLLGRWQKQQDGLLSNDVLVVNDAALLSLRQKEWMLKAARAAAARLAFVDGARLVEIDGGAMGLDAEQLAVFGG